MKKEEGVKKYKMNFWLTYKMLYVRMNQTKDWIKLRLELRGGG